MVTQSLSIGHVKVVEVATMTNAICKIIHITVMFFFVIYLYQLIFG